LKLPKTVRVGGHDISITYENEPKVDGDDCWGSYEAETKIIALKKSLCPSMMTEVFIHEVIHAVAINRCLKLTESEVGVLASGLYAFLRDNGYIK
jgi:hypothetical protein